MRQFAPLIIPSFVIGAIQSMDERPRSVREAIDGDDDADLALLGVRHSLSPRSAARKTKAFGGFLRTHFYSELRTSNGPRLDAPGGAGPSHSRNAGPSDPRTVRDDDRTTLERRPICFADLQATFAGIRAVFFAPPCPFSTRTARCRSSTPRVKTPPRAPTSTSIGSFRMLGRGRLVSLAPLGRRRDAPP